MPWTRTSTINRYTDEPNYYLHGDLCHAIVFRRQYTWAYTVRGHLIEERWIQISSDSQSNLSFGEAIRKAEQDMYFIISLFSGILVPQPVKPRSPAMEKIMEDVETSFNPEDTYEDR